MSFFSINPTFLFILSFFSRPQSFLPTKQEYKCIKTFFKSKIERIRSLGIALVEELPHYFTLITILSEAFSGFIPVLIQYLFILSAMVIHSRFSQQS